MVPFAGRIRRGVLDFEGRVHHLPPSLGPHAIHGYGFISAWERLDDATIGLELADPWPFRASVTQRFELLDDALTMTMTLVAYERQPVTLGWHPWFRRDLGNGVDVELDFDAGAMYERDEDGMPSGVLVDPSDGPWDDCFTDLRSAPTLRWGSLALEFSSSADHWVVYDEPAHAICIEPQTGPPNGPNDVPDVLEAGQERTIDFTLSWR